MSRDIIYVDGVKRESRWELYKTMTHLELAQDLFQDTNCEVREYLDHIASTSIKLGVEDILNQP